MPKWLELTLSGCVSKRALNSDSSELLDKDGKMLPLLLLPVFIITITTSTHSSHLLNFPQNVQCTVISIYLLMYSLPDVVKMNRSLLFDHPTSLRAVISISYDVLGESPEIWCSNIGTFSLSTSGSSFQSDSESTVSFTAPLTTT